MKILYVETRYKGRIAIPKKIIEKLPKRTGLFLTAQYITHLDPIRSQLEKQGKEVHIFKTRHTKYAGQIYGCNLEKFKGIDGFFYVGEGLFHPKALLLGNGLSVHTYDPITKEYACLTRKLIEDELKRQKGALVTFYTKNNIGVFVSTKHGQSYLDLALGLKARYPDKSFYYFVFDTLDFTSLDDFPYIDVWVNTACPRIGFDDTKRARKPVLDIGSIL